MKKGSLLIAIFAVLLLGLTACTPAVSVGVVSATVEGIKTSYAPGDELVLDEAFLVLTKSDGSTEQVAITMDMIKGWDNQAIGSHTLSIRSSSFSTTFVYTIVEKEVQDPVSRVVLEGLPKQYTKGDVLMIQGATAKIVYADGTEEEQELQSHMVQYFATEKVGMGTASVVVTTKYGKRYVDYTYEVMARPAITNVVVGEGILQIFQYDEIDALYALVSALDYDLTYEDGTQGKGSVISTAAISGFSSANVGKATVRVRVSDAYGLFRDVNLSVQVNARLQAQAVSFYMSEGADTPYVRMTDSNGIVEPMPATPRKGYEMKGWFPYENGRADGAAFDFSTVLTYPISLVAVYQRIDYLVSITGHDGNVRTIMYNIESPTLPLERPFARLGYEFVGYVDEKDGLLIEQIPAGTTGNMRLVERWNALQYAVTYDMGDSKALPATNSPLNATTYALDDDTSELVLHEPTRPGYTFTGWTRYDAATHRDVAVTSLQSCHEDITLRATWAPKQLTVKYMDPANGAYLHKDLSYTVESGELRLATVTVNGNQFDGWYLDMECTIPMYKNGLQQYALQCEKFPESFELYAKLLTMYSVTIDFEGGIAPIVLSFTKEKGLVDAPNADSTIQIAYTAPKGVDVVGVVDQNGNPLVDGNDVPIVTADNYGLTTSGEKLAVYDGETLYAEMVGHTHSIHYIFGHTDDQGNAEATEAYDAGTTHTLLVPMARRGYTFGGWCWDVAERDLVGESIPAFSYDKDLEFEALWIMDDPYTITLHYDTLDPAVFAELEDTLVESGLPTHYTVLTNTIDFSAYAAPTLAHHDFVLWYLTPDFQPGTSISYIYSGETGDVHLYAKWTPHKGRVYLRDMGNVDYSGEGTDFSTEFTYDQGTIVLPVKPTRSHYTFAGWYADADCTQPMTSFEASEHCDSILYVYAKWTANSHKLYYYDNSLKRTETFTHDAPLSLCVIEKTGYELEGWYWDSKLTDPVTDDWTNFTYYYDRDLKVYAKYVKATYTITYHDEGGVVAEDGTYDGGTLINSYQMGDAAVNSSNLTKNLITPVANMRFGYKLDGWYLDAALTRKVTVIGANGTSSGYAPLSDLHLYAKWTPITYQFKFRYLMPGSTSFSNANTNDTVNSTINDLPISLWTTVNGRMGYTVGVGADDEFCEGTWYLDNTLTGVAYTTFDLDDLLANKELISLTSGNYVFTFYGKLRQDQYPVTYVMPEGAVNHASNPDYITYSTTGKALGKPTYDGYKFINWYEDEDYSAVKTQLKNELAPVTLYARFEKEYTATYVVEAGTTPTSTVFTADVGLQKSASPKLASAPSTNPSGSKFYKWWCVTDHDAFILIDDILPAGVASNVTLYAMYYNCTQANLTFSFADGSATVEGTTASSLSGALTLPTVVGNSMVSYDVVAVASSAFAGKLMTSINWTPAGATPTIQTIGAFAFNGCTSLTSVTLPDSIVSVEMGAFRGCTKLVSYTQHSGILSKSNVLDGCTALTTLDLTGVSLSTGNLATLFSRNIPPLATLCVDGSVASYSLFGKSQLECMYYSKGYYLPASVKSIVLAGNGVLNAVDGWRDLTQLTIQYASVVEIPESLVASLSAMEGLVIKVPSELLSAYEEAYSTLTFVTI